MRRATDQLARTGELSMMYTLGTLNSWWSQERRTISAWGWLKTWLTSEGDSSEEKVVDLDILGGLEIATVATSITLDTVIVWK
jgi:hypothetical protein